MKLRVMGFALCLGLLALGGFARASEVLYATGVRVGTGPISDPGGLYAIDTQTGRSTRVQSLDFFAHQGGLAYDAASDQLYATGYDNTSRSGLWRIDRFNHTDTFIGYLDDPASGFPYLFAGGLAIDPLSGRMVGVARNGQQNTALYSINKVTAATTLLGQNAIATPLGPTGLPLIADLGGVGFASDGTLYANGTYRELFSAAETLALFTVDSMTGATRIVGANGQDIVSNNGGLHFSEPAEDSFGQLFSLGGITAATHGLYRLNKTTGAATLVGPSFVDDGSGQALYFGSLGGTAFAPGAPRVQTVPEPSLPALLLLALGVWVLVSGLARRR